MTVFVIQAFLLTAIAFILGCVVGCLLHWLFGAKSDATVAKPEPAAKVVKPEPKVEAKPEPAPKPKPKPKQKAAAKPKQKTAPAPAAKDDLKRIRGIGPQNEAKLNSEGIHTFAQVASWSAAEQRDLGERLAFPGRIEREEWVKQAKVLAKGGTTDFAKRVDKGEVESSSGEASPDDAGTKPSALKAAPTAGADDLTLIDGVGGAIEKKLQGLGIFSFEQISKWTKDNQVWIGNEIGFPGRPERENWVSEAKKLAKGGAAKPAKKAERGEIKTSRKARI